MEIFHRWKMTDSFPAKELYELLVYHLVPQNNEQHRSIFNLVGSLTLDVSLDRAHGKAALPDGTFDDYVRHANPNSFSIAMNGRRIEFRSAHLNVEEDVLKVLKFADIEVLNREKGFLAILPEDNRLVVDTHSDWWINSLMIVFQHRLRVRAIEISTTDTPEQVLTKLESLTDYDGVQNIRQRYYHAMEQQLVADSATILAEEFPEQYAGEVLEYDVKRQTPLVSRHNLAALAHGNIITRGNFLQQR